MMKKVSKKRLGVLLVVTLFTFVFMSTCVVAKETITFRYHHSGPTADFFKRMTDVFNAENPDIFVEVQQEAPGDNPELYITAFLGDTAPDVWYQHYTGYISAEMKYGFTLDLAPYVKDWPELDTLLDPGSLDWYTYDGKLAAFPITYQMVGLFVRKSWMDKVGWGKSYPYIESWSDLLELAEKFTFGDADGDGQDNTIGYGMFGSMAWEYASKQFGMMMNAAGEEVIEDGNFNFNTDIARFVLQSMQDYVLTSKVSAPDTANWSHVEFYRDVVGGKIGIGRVGSWNLPTWDEAIEKDYDTIPYPPVEKGEPNFQSYECDPIMLSGNGDAKQIEASLKYLQFMAGKEWQTEYFKVAGKTNRKDLDLAELYPDPRIMYFFTPRPALPQVNDPRYVGRAKLILCEAINKCLIDPEADPGQELAMAEEKIAKIWGK